MRRLVIAMSLVCAGLLGCDGDNGSPDLQTSPGDGLPANHPDVDALRSLATARGSGRLSVNQLRLSFPIVAGATPEGEPLTWNLLETNRAALGEPDYANVTIENFDPSPLYAKFMEDAARELCGKILSNDRSLATAQERTLYRFVDFTDTVENNPTGVDQNLRYLKLRFHGIRIADDDHEGVAKLRTLFARGVETAQGERPETSEAHISEGWRLVCVALTTAAEFHIY